LKSPAFFRRFLQLLSLRRPTAFNPNKTPNVKINLTACFECHKAQASHDFVHDFDKLKQAAR